MTDHEEPEDVLGDSLHTLYGYQPITLASAGAMYTHQYISGDPQAIITLQTPDPEAVNWALHASSIWVASAQLACQIECLRLDEHLQRVRRDFKNDRKLKVLELGAAAGLPSILISKLYPDISVLATDYPDDNIIYALTQNIVRNGVQTNCRAMGYAWGTDPSSLIGSDSSNPSSPGHGVFSPGFDVIIAADTLWNPDLHGIFIDTLQKTLLKDPEARVNLVVGLHTGRYTVESFLYSVRRAGFQVVDVLEREVVRDDNHRGGTRGWDAARPDSEEKDRRAWVIWIELCWDKDLLPPRTFKQSN